MAQPKGSTPWNKGKRIAPLRKCDFCERKNPKVSYYKKYNYLLCQRHYWHFRTWGRVKTDEEVLKDYKEKWKERRGEKIWNWKGGRATLNMIIRRCSKYKWWVRQVFIKDDFTCKKCKKKGGRLEADHYPKTFSEIMDKKKITTYEQALECSELWDISNGRTLCRKCHRKI
jgi:hypothetical protein